MRMPGQCIGGRTARPAESATGCTQAWRSCDRGLETTKPSVLHSPFLLERPFLDFVTARFLGSGLYTGARLVRRPSEPLRHHVCVPTGTSNLVPCLFLTRLRRHTI